MAIKVLEVLSRHPWEEHRLSFPFLSRHGLGTTPAAGWPHRVTGQLCLEYIYLLTCQFVNDHSTSAFHSASALNVARDTWGGCHGAILVARALSSLNHGDSLMSLGCHLKLLLLQSPCLPTSYSVPSASNLSGTGDPNPTDSATGTTDHGKNCALKRLLPFSSEKCTLSGLHSLTLTADCLFTGTYQGGYLSQ